MRRMMFFPLALGMSMLAMPVSAQQQPPPPQQQQSPSERALGNKLMTEINAGLQCNAQLVGAADQIATLQKELAEEKAKNVKPVEAPK